MTQMWVVIHPMGSRAWLWVLLPCAGLSPEPVSVVQKPAGTFCLLTFDARICLIIHLMMDSLKDIYMVLSTQFIFLNVVHAHGSRSVTYQVLALAVTSPRLCAVGNALWLTWLVIWGAGGTELVCDSPLALPLHPRTMSPQQWGCKMEYHSEGVEFHSSAGPHWRCHPSDK